MQPREIINLIAENIYVGERLRKTVDPERVAALASSIEKIGLMTPITIRTVREMEIDGVKETDVPVLVAGLHRLEAIKKLGIESIQCLEMDDNDIEAQLWEIAENLHRSELTALERDQHIAKWIELADRRILVQIEPKMGRGRPQGGVRAASRDLGVQHNDALRAIKVASLSQNAKDAAIRAGLDDNRSALLEAARESTPQAQVAAIERRSMLNTGIDPKTAVDAAEEDLKRLQGAWNKACAEARKAFREWIDEPVMDRRFA